MSAEDRVAVVSGAAAGIGARTAVALGQAGYAVSLWDLTDCRDTAAELDALGVPVLALGVDVGDPDSVARAAAQTRADLGPATAVFAAAGIMRVSPFLELTAAAWEQTLRVNLTGTFLVLQACAAAMVESGVTGAMVAVSSVAGRGPRPDAADYAASKAAILSLVRSAAVALAGSGIRVNAICPGLVDTEMTRRNTQDRSAASGVPDDVLLERMVAGVPLGRLARPEEVAAIALRLLGPDFGYVTGQALNVCGGLEFD